MRAEIISIGTELLLGQVVNSNAAFISRELAALGIEVYHHVTVGDNADRLTEAVQAAEKRADLIVLSGGLGPTEDDITKQTIAKYLNVDLLLHEETEDRIITYHKNSDFEMPENNQLQALILAESIPLKNDTGLAVGMILEREDHQYVLLPGPPDELHPMVENHLKDELIKRLLDEQVLVSRVLRFFGITEAQLAKKIEPIVKAQTNPTVAVYANEGEITVRITARAKTEEEGNRCIDEIESLILEPLTDYFFGYGEKRLAEAVRDLLIEQGLTITAAESLTGGAFLSSITADVSAGSVFEGGIVTYSTEKKQKVLNISAETIENFGVVSPECAIEMAENSRKMFKADIGVGLTGVAGPGSLEDQIPGTVYIGLSYKEDPPFAKRFHFGYKRNKNRQLAVLNAHDMVRRLILGKPVKND
ncbi:nicotinamide-nucleotide amidase [Alkalibacterium subtropicum]|uniref:Putative competence-damage inducible protein n=1 Tax=Alkalibacterium subtropicum TaxID=753702 RepID=A0A1I1E749_9LACT|nr:competence/damage-inducible protein A [Alkalibacterium subtropicum]SFB82907.1 nicotinamide-nucleotide amidase [Alkalibacterium subtropicum]